jgi:hypothetical protein
MSGPTPLSFIESRDYKMHTVALALVLVVLVVEGFGENITVTGDGWQYICIGNCENDKKTQTQGGRILMGGGTDVDDAFRWLIKNSG